MMVAEGWGWTVRAGGQSRSGHEGKGRMRDGADRGHGNLLGWAVGQRRIQGSGPGDGETRLRRSGLETG